MSKGFMVLSNVKMGVAYPKLKAHLFINLAMIINNKNTINRNEIEIALQYLSIKILNFLRLTNLEILSVVFLSFPAN